MILKSKKLDLIKTYLINNRSIFHIKAGAYDEREEDFTLTISIGNNNYQSYFSQSGISCGVYDITSLPRNVYLQNILINVKPKFKAKFLKELYSEIFAILKRKEKMCTVLASTNNDTSNSVIISTFNSIAKHKTLWKTNPNSGNKIRTWIF